MKRTKTLKQIEAITGVDWAADAIYVNKGDHTAHCYAQTFVSGNDGHWCKCARKGTK